MRFDSRNFLFLCVALLPAMVALPGCGGPSTEPAAEEEAEIKAYTKTYTVRGQITQLPDPDRAGSELMVHHEMIPDFENAQGEVVGMNAMIMPFPLAEGVSIEGFEPGTKVEMTFEMRFKPKTYYEVTEITELPAEAELDLGGMVGGEV